MLHVACINMEPLTGEGNLEIECSLQCAHVEGKSVRSVVQGTRDVEAGSRLIRTGSTQQQGSRLLQEVHESTIRRIRRIRLRLSSSSCVAHLHFLNRAIQQITRHPAPALTFGWRLPERFD
jgi:hypothetical protein